MTQCERLLSRLKEGPVTAKQASKELAIDRCSARILELREAGHPIITKMKSVKNRFGEICRVAEYSL